jgi:hypothetical protein
MALDIQQVQPGDLVTASFFNELIALIEQLDARVTVLEEGELPGGAVAITAVSPQPVRVGQDLTIVGANFGFSAGAHRVRFNGVQPSAFRPGSRDDVLICLVPSVPGLQETGTPVTLTVSNATSTAARVVTLLPPVVAPVGNVDVTFEGATPDPLTANANNEFEFTLHSDASLPVSLVLTPTVRTPAGAALAWPTAILDAGRAEIGDRQVTVAPGQSVTVFARVAIPASTNGTQFLLRVDAAGAGIEASSGDLDHTVGQTGDPDPAIVKLSPSASEGLSGSEISAPVGTIREIAVECDLAMIGTYTVTLASLGGATNWTIVLAAPGAADPRFIVDEDDLGPDGIADRAVRFRVRPNAGATGGQLRLTVQRAGVAMSRSYTFDMRVG